MKSHLRVGDVNSLVDPENVTHKVTNPVIPFPDLRLSEMKPNIHTKTCIWIVIAAQLCNSQKVQTAPLSVNWQMNKSMTACPFDGMFFSNKKEGSSDIRYNAKTR